MPPAAERGAILMFTRYAATSADRLIRWSAELTPPPPRSPLPSARQQ